VSPYTIWQSENFSIAQSYDFPLPGYLFVECTSGAASMSELKAAELVELSHVLQRAESLIDSLIKPARTSKTWSGRRGKQPLWFVDAVKKRGVTAESLLIDGSTITTKVFAKAAKKAVKKATKKAFKKTATKKTAKA